MCHVTALTPPLHPLSSLRSDLSLKLPGGGSSVPGGGGAFGGETMLLSSFILSIYKTDSALGLQKFVHMQT